MKEKLSKKPCSSDGLGLILQNPQNPREPWVEISNFDFTNSRRPFFPEIDESHQGLWSLRLWPGATLDLEHMSSPRHTLGHSLCVC